MGEEGALRRGIVQTVDGEWEKGMKFLGNARFQNYRNVAIVGLDMPDGFFLESASYVGGRGGYLANSRRARVATGALRFFTRRMFRGGEDQLRDKRSRSWVSVSVSS